MAKQYQTTDVTASTPELTIPEKVSVALAEIAESAKEGLLALAVGAGLQVLGTLMEESVTALAGPQGKHNPDRTAVRHGHEHGSVTLGGRRVAVQRPRVRAADGSGELPVAAYQLFSGTEILGRLALERMLGGLSTRRYGVDASLWSGLGAGRQRGGAGRVGHQQVGGVAAVCGHDPHRAGGAAGRGPVRAGPGSA
jgi:putative transposase